MGAIFKQEISKEEEENIFKQAEVILKRDK